MKNRFRKYDGNKIPDIIEYIREYINSNPSVTISVGCDSNRKRRGSVYATTIMFYDNVCNDGAHIIYKKDYIKGNMDIFTRLYKEAELAFEIVEYIEENLNDCKRADITDYEIKKYKLHLEQHKGKYLNPTNGEEELLINSMQITEFDKHISYRLCDIHLDYNMEDGDGKNRSYAVFKAVMPWLKSCGYRVWSKPYSSASTTAADALIR